ncbi:hypothetical protein Tco_1435657, partial [Tanacetum coccineum]
DKVDYVYLLWEDLVFQIENNESRKNKYMFYLRFTKVIINHFMSQDQSIPRRNKVDWHMANDDPILTTMRFIPQHEVVQRYDAILLDYLTNPTMKESKAYKTYHDLATGKIAKSGKKKQPTPGLEALSDIALTKAGQMKLSIERSKTQLHISQPSSSGAHEGTGKSSDEEDDDDEANVGKYKDDDDYDDDDDDDDDDEQTESDNDGEDFVHPKFSTHDDEAKQEDEENKEDSFDLRVQTPSHVSITDDNNDDEIQGANVAGKEMDEDETNAEGEENELYRDVNVNLKGRDVEMTDAQQTNVQTTQVLEDTHVIITPVNPKGQQKSSSVSFGFVSNMLNPRPNIGIDSIFNIEATSLVDVPVTTIAEPPLVFATTLPPPPTPLITHMQQTPFPKPTTAPSTSLQDLPNFGSLFGFDHRLKTLETNFNEFKQTNQFAKAVSSIPDIVDAYLANKMNDAVKTVKITKEQVKEQVKAQVSKILPKIEKTVNEQLEAEVMTCSSTESKTSLAIAANLSELELKKILIEKMESNKSINRCKDDEDRDDEEKMESNNRRDDEDKDEEPSAGSNRGGANAHRKDLEEPAHQEFDIGATKEQTDKETSQHPDWFQKPAKLPTPNRDWNKSLPAIHGPVQPWLSNLAREEGPRESFDKLMDTPLYFLAFMMNRLKIDTLTLNY